jgi:hypothetical protein
MQAMLRVLEYDQAKDGGFIVWVEDGPHRSWFAHHMTTRQWMLTNPDQGGRACSCLPTP